MDAEEKGGKWTMQSQLMFAFFLFFSKLTIIVVGRAGGEGGGGEGKGGEGEEVP